MVTEKKCIISIAHKPETLMIWSRCFYTCSMLESNILSCVSEDEVWLEKCVVGCFYTDSFSVAFDIGDAPIFYVLIYHGHVLCIS